MFEAWLMETRSVLPSTTQRPLRTSLLALLLAAVGTAVFAERPMVVDDAGGLERGGAKVEFGLNKDVDAVGGEAAVGYVPVDHIELELAVGRARSDGTATVETIRAVGAALKWVPIQAETGLSAGFKYAFGHERVSGSPIRHANAVSALVSWRFEGGSAVHANLGREWSRSGGDRDAVNIWGVGVEVPLAPRLCATVEAFGLEHEGMARQAGLRYEIAEGLKVSGAVGHGAQRSLANLGLTWKF